MKTQQATCDIDTVDFRIVGQRAFQGGRFGVPGALKHAENKLCTHFAYECARLVGRRFSRETA